MDKIDNQQSVNDIYGIAESVIKEDVKYITGDYLINNIELAFKVWEEQPWGKDVPFDIFCEEILPYRIAHEPLENWREKVLAGFAELNRSFKTQEGITAEAACSLVNARMPLFTLISNIPEMNYSMLVAATKGSCEEITILTVFTMRALGIPAAQDYMPKWPYSNVGHEWTSVYSSKGKHLSLETEYNPEAGINNHEKYPKVSKIYRRTYAKQKNIEAVGVNIPPALCDHRYIADATDEYLAPVACSSRGKGIDIPVERSPAKNTGYVYLAARGKDDWNITGWGKIIADTVRFGTVGRNVLHLPVHYENGMQIPAGYPFIVYD
jgi:hypothetical protein